MMAHLGWLSPVCLLLYSHSPKLLHLVCEVKRRHGFGLGADASVLPNLRVSPSLRLPAADTDEALRWNFSQPQRVALPLGFYELGRMPSSFWTLYGCFMRNKSVATFMPPLKLRLSRAVIGPAE